jgi:hypothetical protein
MTSLSGKTALVTGGGDLQSHKERPYRENSATI